MRKLNVRGYGSCKHSYSRRKKQTVKRYRKCFFLFGGWEGDTDGFERRTTFSTEGSFEFLKGSLTPPTTRSSAYPNHSSVEIIRKRSSRKREKAKHWRNWFAAALKVPMLGFAPISYRNIEKSMNLQKICKPQKILPDFPESYVSKNQGEICDNCPVFWALHR